MKIEDAIEKQVFEYKHVLRLLAGLMGELAQNLSGTINSINVHLLDMSNETLEEDALKMHNGVNVVGEIQGAASTIDRLCGEQKRLRDSIILLMRVKT